MWEIAKRSATSTTGEDALPADGSDRELEDWELELAAFRQSARMADRDGARNATPASVRTAVREPALAPDRAARSSDEPAPVRAEPWVPPPINRLGSWEKNLSARRDTARETTRDTTKKMAYAARDFERDLDRRPQDQPPRREAGWNAAARDISRDIGREIGTKVDHDIGRDMAQKFTTQKTTARTVPDAAPKAAPEPHRAPERAQQREAADTMTHETTRDTTTETTRDSAARAAAPPQPAAQDKKPEPLIRVGLVSEHVALLTLNAPKIRNALTAEMRLSLRGVLKTLAANDAVHALVVTGAEGNFCAGGDVRTMGETDPRKIRARMDEVAETALAVAEFPKPVIAAVAGHAAGAGISLACLADIVVAEANAQFTFSFLRLALGPDWGLTWSLARRVGATLARGLILSRGAIGAKEALHIGLVDYIADGSARDVAVTLAKTMCDGPREATAAVKRMLGDIDGLRAALAAETAMQLERFPAWEHQEGARAFKEKRPANFDPPKR